MNRITRWIFPLRRDIYQMEIPIIMARSMSILAMEYQPSLYTIPMLPRSLSRKRIQSRRINEAATVMESINSCMAFQLRMDLAVKMTSPANRKTLVKK